MVSLYVLKGKKSETELTADVLKKKDPKAHRRLLGMIFNQTKQDRMRIFEEILFLKATDNTKDAYCP